MSNIAMRSAYIVMAAITLSTIVLSLKTHKKKALAGIFLFYSSMTFCWQLTLILKFTVKAPDLIRFFNNAILPFVAFTSLGAFIYVLRFYGMERYYSNAVVASLCVCPAITTAIAVFGYKSEYLTTGYALISIDPVLKIQGEYGLWFWVHAVYCYILIAAAFVGAIARHRGLPKTYKDTSVVLLAGMIGSVFCSALNVTGIFKAPVDLALVGITFCGVFMYLAAQYDRGLEHVYAARRGIFNSLSEAVFILDSDRRIISANQSALNIMRKMGIEPEVKKFSCVTEHIHPDTFVTGASEEEEDTGSDFLLAGEVFNMREKTITDTGGKVMGHFALIKNVNQNRRLIRHLEEEAGMDALTGLYNRVKMDKMREALDTPENYPIAVICGDMNGLKEVNDIYGHQQGDVLLMAGAEALVSSCPPSACIGRVGGDEFLILLPGYSEQRAKELIGEIEERMHRMDEYQYVVSMSLGVAVKENAGQRLDDIISAADGRMYQSKIRYKKSRGLRPPRRGVATG